MVRLRGCLYPSFVSEEAHRNWLWKPMSCIIIHPNNVRSVLGRITFFWWFILLTDLPVGRQDLLVLLKKLIRYIQIKVKRRRKHTYVWQIEERFSVIVCAWYLSSSLSFSSFLDSHILRSHSPSSVSVRSATVTVWHVNVLHLLRLKLRVLLHREGRHNYTLHRNR